ncbi:MAG TPA: acetyl-CoA carboxylase, carboxyltransferase subunit beta, partial [Myxococcota bacterium]|nr:acetyl-CoA carboxylase, carboxyltransferase subunit beta [Myxococcota bacterium]
WFEHSKGFEARPRRSGAEDTADLWTRCPSCGETLFNDTLADNQQVCPSCGHHFPLGARDRIEALCDPGELAWHDRGLRSVDALRFVDSKPYDKRYAATVAKTGFNDAFLAASAEIHGMPVEIGSFEFSFMGGSMGSVVGEMVTRVFERAAERRVPAIVVSASGGARMQEGVLSLMQMAKTCAALARLRDEARMPYLSLLAHPTTGGVAASFSMLGDLILAEPGALIGFAGPRVIKETIGQDLPEGFQTSEYLLAHGMVDMIVPRLQVRATVGRVLAQLLGLPSPLARA